MTTPSFGGVMETGKYIDFHNAGSTADYDGRLYITDSGNFYTNDGKIVLATDLTAATTISVTNQYSKAEGSYIKIGKLVLFNLTITATTNISTSSGTLKCLSVPAGGSVRFYYGDGTNCNISHCLCITESGATLYGSLSSGQFVCLNGAYMASS